MHRGFKIVFWGIETILAIVSGMGEALIYQAYGPDNWAGISTAFLRAGCMQLGIIVFGMAAVRASQQGRGGMVWLAHGFSFVFSAISAWFVREAAIADRHLQFLLPAYNQPLGGLSGQQLDPNLVGAIPFIIMAVNIFAPVILNDGKIKYDETEAETAERYRREEAEQIHRNRMRGKVAEGWRNAITGRTEETEQPPPVVEAPAPVIAQPRVVVEAATFSNGHSLERITQVLEEKAPSSVAVVEADGPPKPGSKAFTDMVIREYNRIAGAEERIPSAQELADLFHETLANIQPAYNLAKRKKRQ